MKSVLCEGLSDTDDCTCVLCVAAFVVGLIIGQRATDDPQGHGCVSPFAVIIVCDVLRGTLCS